MTPFRSDPRVLGTLVDAPWILSKLSSNLPPASNRATPPLCSMKGLGKILEWGIRSMVGMNAHMYTHTSHKQDNLQTCVDRHGERGIRNLNKCALDRDAAARERILRKIILKTFGDVERSCISYELLNFKREFDRFVINII